MEQLQPPDGMLKLQLNSTDVSFFFFVVPGSDASEVNMKSAQKVNQIAASLQHDNTRRGSSAAESQGTLNYLLFEPGIF